MKYLSSYSSKNKICIYCDWNFLQKWYLLKSSNTNNKRGHKSLMIFEEPLNILVESLKLCLIENIHSIKKENLVSLWSFQQLHDCMKVCHWPSGQLTEMHLIYKLWHWVLFTILKNLSMWMKLTNSTRHCHLYMHA